MNKLEGSGRERKGGGHERAKLRVRAEVIIYNIYMS